MLEFRGIAVSYHAGMAFLFVGFALFMVGFSCPYWTGYEKYNIGLWLVCSPRDCRSQSTISPLFGGWWSAVQFFQCLSLLGFVATTGHGILVTWVAPCLDLGPYSVPYLNRPRHRHFLMAGSAFAGVCGLAGNAIFVAKVTTGDSPYSVFCWAFAINVVGCFFALIASIIIAVFRCHQTHLLTTAISLSNRQQQGEIQKERISRGKDIPSPFLTNLPEDTPRTVWSCDQISTRL